jgi:hypothetical protein
MRQATGWELPEPNDREPLVHREGGLVVESYRSGVADPADHIRQCREVLPHLLSTYVRARWEPSARLPLGPVLDLGAALPGLVDRLYGWLSSLGETLGARALHVALGELGVHETPGPGDTARVLEYLRGCVRGGKPLGLASDSFEWCAAFFSWSAFMACRPGEKPNHEWRAAVTELAADARTSGRLRLAGTGYTPKPGDGVIWGRNGEDPLAGGHGHVARVLDVDGGAFRSVGGNEAATGIVQVIAARDGRPAAQGVDRLLVDQEPESPRHADVVEVLACERNRLAIRTFEPCNLGLHVEVEKIEAVLGHLVDRLPTRRLLIVRSEHAPTSR